MLRRGTFRIWRPGETSARKAQDHKVGVDYKCYKKAHQDNNDKNKENKYNESDKNGKENLEEIMQDENRKKHRRKPYARWLGGAGSLSRSFSFSFHRKKSPLANSSNNEDSSLNTKTNGIKSPFVVNTNEKKNEMATEISKKDKTLVKGSTDSGLESDASYLEVHSPTGVKKWSFNPTFFRSMSFKTESESEFCTDSHNGRRFTSTTINIDQTGSTVMRPPSGAIGPTDYNSRTSTPGGRDGINQSADHQLGRSNSTGIIKTENSTLNRKSKKLAFYEPAQPYQSVKVERSQSGIISRSQTGMRIRSQSASVGRFKSGFIPSSQTGMTVRSQSGTIERSQFGTVERSQSGTVERSQFGTVERSQTGIITRAQSGTLERSQSRMLERSPSGLLKLSQTRSAVQHSQSRPVERSQSMAINRSQSGTRPLSQSRPVERSQSMAIGPSQSRRNNRSHSVEPEVCDFLENKRSLASFKSTEFGSQLITVRKTDHEALLTEQVGNVSSQWQHLCKSASIEVILNIPNVDVFTINVIFNCNIISSLNPVEISSVIFNTRNILFANWFIAGPNLAESIVRRSPHFNVILYQIQTFLIIVSGNCINKFVNLFKDLQNRCISEGFYKPWICLEETKSLYIEFWYDLVAKGV